MGGILIFTVDFNEPFFTTVLHAIECNRLQTITSRASINRVFKKVHGNMKKLIVDF